MSKTAISLWDKVQEVNAALKAGEPGNISYDSYSGYTGYSPQAIIDAVNEIIGVDRWGFSNDKIRLFNEGELAVCKITVWLLDRENIRTARGQSRVTRGDIGDAFKGAQTDAIKKALSLFSIGNRAYLGLLVSKETAQQPATESDSSSETTQKYMMGKATDKQMSAIAFIGVKVGKKLDETMDELCRIFKVESVDNITKQQASDVISGRVKLFTDEEQEMNEAETSVRDEDIRPEDVPF